MFVVSGVGPPCLSEVIFGGVALAFSHVDSVRILSETTMLFEVPVCGFNRWTRHLKRAKLGRRQPVPPRPIPTNNQKRETRETPTMSEHVRLNTNDGVATLTIDRPDKRNALRREIIQALLDSVRQVGNDSSVRVLVLNSTGKVFCAGMDLGQMQERAESPNSSEEWQQDSQVLCDLLCELQSLPIPTIACLQGPALAGGVGLVVACDIVIATDETFFMLPEPMRGITAAMVTPLLIHRVGSGPATYMLLSNERIPATNSFGLCHAVVPSAELQTRLDTMIAAILGGSRSAFALTKKHIVSSLSYDLSKQVEQSMQVSAEARATHDAREGLAAFLEKRKPSWQAQ